VPGKPAKSNANTAPLISHLPPRIFRPRHD
jgi:hypothetical protein